MRGGSQDVGVGESNEEMRNVGKGECTVHILKRTRVQ
jgi:hypothetical protein